MHQLDHTSNIPNGSSLGTGRKRNHHSEALDMTWHGLKVARSNTSKTKFRFSLLHNASTGKCVCSYATLEMKTILLQDGLKGTWFELKLLISKTFIWVKGQTWFHSNEIVATSYYLDVNQFHGRWRMQHYCCFFYMAIQSWLYTYYRFYYVSSWYGNIQYIFLSWYIVAILFD